MQDSYYWVFLHCYYFKVSEYLSYKWSFFICTDWGGQEECKQTPGFGGQAAA